MLCFVKLRIDRITPFLHRGTQGLPVRRVAIAGGYFKFRSAS
jgi:hypothetical protein